GAGGRAVELVVGVAVAEPERHVGLSDDDRSSRLQPFHCESVGSGTPVFELGVAPGGRQAGDIELLLDRHRQAEQRALLSARQGGEIGRASCREGVEISEDDPIIARTAWPHAALRPWDCGRFSAVGCERPLNLPSIKKAGSTLPTPKTP